MEILTIMVVSSAMKDKTDCFVKVVEIKINIMMMMMFYFPKFIDISFKTRLQ